MILNKKELFDVFCEHSQKLHHYARCLSFSFGLDDFLAENACQEAFVNVYKIYHRLDSQGFYSYLKKSVKNYLIDEVRKQNKFRNLPSESKVNDQDFLKKIVKDEVEDQLSFCLKKLSESHQKVIFLKFYEDFSILEIASFLGEKEGTIKSRLHRGIQNLKKCMEDNND